jgi:hypothetical protein
MLRPWAITVASIGLLFLVTALRASHNNHNGDVMTMMMALTTYMISFF